MWNPLLLYVSKPVWADGGTAKLVIRQVRKKFWLVQRLDEVADLFRYPVSPLLLPRRDGIGCLA